MNTKPEPKAIGPVPATVDGAYRGEATPDIPFKVNRNSPAQQALAKRVGWDRLKEIEKVDAQPTDLQRGPFPSKAKPVDIKPRKGNY